MEYGRCEACEASATHVCHGTNVEPWKLCLECMFEHQGDCADLRAGRALVEELVEATNA